MSVISQVIQVSDARVLSEAFIGWASSYADRFPKKSVRFEMAYMVKKSRCLQFVQALKSGDSLAAIRVEDVLNHGCQRPTYMSDLTPTSEWQGKEPTEAFKQTWSLVRCCVLEGAAAPVGTRFLTSYQQTDGQETVGRCCYCHMITLLLMPTGEWRFVDCGIDPSSMAMNMFVVGALDPDWVSQALQEVCTDSRNEAAQDEAAEVNDVVHSLFQMVFDQLEVSGSWREEWEVHPDAEEDCYMLDVMDANMRGDGLDEKPVGWLKQQLKTNPIEKSLAADSAVEVANGEQAAPSRQELLLAAIRKSSCSASAKERLREVLEMVLQRPIEPGSIIYSVTSVGEPPAQSYVGTVRISCVEDILNSSGDLVATGETLRADHDTAKQARRAAEQAAALKALGQLVSGTREDCTPSGSHTTEDLELEASSQARASVQSSVAPSSEKEGQAVQQWLSMTGGLLDRVVVGQRQSLERLRAALLSIKGRREALQKEHLERERLFRLQLDALSSEMEDALSSFDIANSLAWSKDADIPNSVDASSDVGSLSQTT